MGFSLAQPYLVNNTILYITFHETLPVSRGYGLIGGYALCYTGIAVRFPARYNMAIQTPQFPYQILAPYRYNHPR